MTRFYFKFSAVALFCCVAAIGCGSGGNDTPSGDAVTDYIKENPQLIEESKARDEFERLKALEDKGENVPAAYR